MQYFKTFNSHAITLCHKIHLPIAFSCRFCASSGDDSHLESTRKVSMMMYGRSFDDLAGKRESCSPQSQSRITSRTGQSTSQMGRAGGGCKTSSSSVVPRTMTVMSSSPSRANTDLWDHLSMNTVEYERQKHLILERNSQNPIYRRLNRSVEQFRDVLEWTIDHIAVPFTWPTRFNEPGQENIVFDEDKVKVTLDVQNNNYKLEELGRAELQDIVLGWTKHVRTVSEEQRQPTDFTPMAEFELWRVLEIKYNTFLEQLKHPFVRETIGKRRKPFRDQFTRMAKG